MPDLVADAKKLYDEEFLKGRHVGKTKFKGTHAGHGYKGSTNTGFYRRAQDQLFEIELYNMLKEKGDTFYRDMEPDIKTNIESFYNALRLCEDDPNSWKNQPLNGPDVGFVLTLFSRVMRTKGLRAAIGPTMRGNIKVITKEMARAIKEAHDKVEYSGEYLRNGETWKEPLVDPTATRSYTHFALNGAGTKGMGLANYYLYMTEWNGEAETSQFIPAMKDYGWALVGALNKDDSWSYGSKTGTSAHKNHNMLNYGAWNTMGAVDIAKASMVYSGGSESDFRRSVFYDPAADYYVKFVNNTTPNSVPFKFAAGWSDPRDRKLEPSYAPSSSENWPGFALAQTAIGTLSSKSAFAEYYPEAKAKADAERSKINDDGETTVHFHRLLEGYYVAFVNGWDTV